MLIWFLRSFLRIPFEWRDPYAYLVLCISTWLTTLCSLMSCVNCVSFAVAFFYFLDAFGEDIKLEMISLNDYNRLGVDSDEFYKRLCNFIEFHSTVIELNRSLILKIHKFIAFVWFSDFHRISQKSSDLFIQHTFYGRLHQFAIHFFYFKWNSLSRFFFKFIFLEWTFNWYSLNWKIGERNSKSFSTFQTPSADILGIRFNLCVLWSWRKIDHSI